MPDVSTFLSPPLLEVPADFARALHLPCVWPCWKWCQKWEQAGQRFQRYVTLPNHACIMLSPLLSRGQLSTRRRRAPPAPWDTSRAAIWPCASHSPCTATASMTAAIRPTRRTAVSHRPLSVPSLVTGSCGRTICLIKNNDTLWMYVYVCGLCFVCCKMWLTATVVLLFAHLNLLSLLPINSYL